MYYNSVFRTVLLLHSVPELIPSRYYSTFISEGACNRKCTIYCTKMYYNSVLWTVLLLHSVPELIPTRYHSAFILEGACNGNCTIYCTL